MSDTQRRGANPDDAARSEAWRDAQQATTVTGQRPETHRGRTTQERTHEDLPPDPDHETAQVGHPHNTPA